MRLFLTLPIFLLFHFSVFGQLTPTIEKQIDEMIEGYTGQPGIAVAILKDDKVVYEQSVGLANLDYDIAINSNTVFELGSLSMHFTAACIRSLEHAGKLTLDDPIQKHLPELPNYAKGNPTIRNLLHHNSGLPDYIIGIEMTKNTFNLAYDKDQALALIAKYRSLGFKPGREYEYSNSNYLLLNHIVSRASGTSLNEYAKENLFKPLGMEQSFFFEETGQVIKNRALGYEGGQEGEDFTLSHNFLFTCAGDGRLQSSVSDMIKWMASFQDKNSPLRKIHDQITENGVMNSGDPMSYAQGLEHGYSSGHHFIGHNGYWAGNNCFYLSFPEAGYSIFTVSNNASINSAGTAYAISDLLLAEEVSTNTKEVPPSIHLSSEELNKWTGDYFLYKTGYTRKVINKNDTLVYQIAEGNERKLEPTGKNTFRLVVAKNNVIEFSINEKGEKEMQFSRDQYKNYCYTSYHKAQPKDDLLIAMVGSYHNKELDVRYDIKKEKDELVLFANGNEYMRYYGVMKNTFCSRSGHNGYLVFDKDSKGNPRFIFNDYSMQGLAFKKVLDSL